MKTVFVSIIVPARNEGRNLARLLESIKKMNYSKKYFEVIVIDGCSTDNTVEIAQKYQTKIFTNNNKIRSAGCQIGVENAKGSIVAFTDADCVVPGNWLKGLLKYLKNKKVAAVGGPNVTPADDTSFSKATGEVLLFLTKAGARYGYYGKKPREIFHNPGCNVIYRKEAIEEVDGFNPSLITCEDEELDYRLRKAGYSLLFTPEVIVDHYRRPTYKKILIQAYRYAYGRAQAIKLHPKMARWFHFIPTLFILSVIAALFLSFTSDHLYSLYLIFSLLIFLLLAFHLSNTNKHTPFYVYLLILFCWFLGWGIGFIKGLLSSTSQRSALHQ